MIRDTDEQPSHMEEMSRTRCVGRGTELPCPLQARRAPQIRSAGPGLWRLHDTDVTDELTGHWGSIPPPGRWLEGGT